MKPIVSLSLVASLNDPRPDHQEEFRRKLEPEANEWLDCFFKEQNHPNSSRSVLHTLLATGWLLARGRKVRFEIEVDGKVKSKEVTSVEELGGLIGDGKTTSTFLQALGGTGRALCS